MSLGDREALIAVTVVELTMQQDFPSGPVVKNPPCNAGDVGSVLVRELRSHMSRGN